MPTDDAFRTGELGVNSMTPGEAKALNVGTIWFPLGMVIALGSFLVWFTWSASGERSQINNRIDNLSASVESLANTVKAILARSGQPDAGVVTRSQFIIDCLQMQVLNPTWKCPYGAQRMDWNPVIESPLVPPMINDRYALRPQ